MKESLFKKQDAQWKYAPNYARVFIRKFERTYIYDHLNPYIIRSFVIFYRLFRRIYPYCRVKARENF